MYSLYKVQLIILQNPITAVLQKMPLYHKKHQWVFLKPKLILTMAFIVSQKHTLSLTHTHR